MSELKAYGIRGIDGLVVESESGQLYLKSEADKVIAEKDKELRQHKYRRCLAMANVEWLKKMILCNHPESILYRRADRRERKWKARAAQYKNNKKLRPAY